jgi:phage regulator Rha-like protein
MFQNTTYSNSVNHQALAPFLLNQDGSYVPDTKSGRGDYIDSKDNPSITSEQIAELLGKRHDRVKLSIKRLASSGSIQVPPVEEVKNSRGQTVRKYVFKGAEGKRDSFVVVAQLSALFTANLVDRWQELEAKNAIPYFALPDSLHGALKLASELEEQRLFLANKVELQNRKIADDAPKVEVYDNIASSTGCIGFQEFCTHLRLKQREVKTWMKDIGWLRLDQHLINPQPTAKAVDGGYCEIRSSTDHGNGNRLHRSIKFTGKALAYVSEHAPSSVRKTSKA